MSMSKVANIRQTLMLFSTTWPQGSRGFSFSTTWRQHKIDYDDASEQSTIRNEW